MMTAHGDPGLVTNATRLGAYAVIDKPFELRDIDPLLREAFNSRESSADAGGRAM
jgi:DNA-binding NtrC family response regulator